MGYKRVGDSWNAVDGSVTGFSFIGDNCPTYMKTESELQSAGFISSSRLVPGHDAARTYWGESWRMPTIGEIRTLKSNTTWTWSSRNGVDGIKFTGKGDYASKSIFLPLAGIGSGTAWQAWENITQTGYLTWSSTHDSLLYARAMKCSWGYSDGKLGITVGAGDNKSVGIQIHPVRDAD